MRVTAGAALMAISFAVAVACGSNGRTSTEPTSEPPTAVSATCTLTRCLMPASNTVATTPSPETVASEPTTTTAPSPVGRVPDGTTRIEVPSSTGQYFVLFVRTTRGGPEVPVTLTRGATGTTVLTDGQP